jgi:hypothetical protein
MPKPWKLPQRRGILTGSKSITDYGRQRCRPGPILTAPINEKLVVELYSK